MIGMATPCNTMQNLGPMAGTTNPNLNAAKLFMRSSSDEPAVTMEDDNS